MYFPVSADGWVTRARRVESPNFNARPAADAVCLLVVHCISLPRGEFGGPAILQLFTNGLPLTEHPDFAGLAGLRVSSHFLIRRDGALLQFVSCAARAWHAGTSSWRGRPDCNDYSIGVELEGVDDGLYTSAQYEVLRALQSGLVARYPLRAMAAHSDIAPGRKTDPGPGFDWSRASAALTRDPG
jgi:AmpD protein